MSLRKTGEWYSGISTERNSDQNEMNNANQYEGNPITNLNNALANLQIHMEAMMAKLENDRLTWEQIENQFQKFHNYSARTAITNSSTPQPDLRQQEIEKIIQDDAVSINKKALLPHRSLKKLLSNAKEYIERKKLESKGSLGKLEEETLSDGDKKLLHTNICSKNIEMIDALIALCNDSKKIVNFCLKNEETQLKDLLAKDFENPITRILNYVDTVRFNLAKSKSWFDANSKPSTFSTVAPKASVPLEEIVVIDPKNNTVKTFNVTKQ